MKKKETKHTPLHSTLKDQSQPSPRIQDHTIAAMGGRLDWGGQGQEEEEEEEEQEEIVSEKEGKIACRDF